MKYLGLPYLLIAFVSPAFSTACTPESKHSDLTPSFSAVIVNDMDVSILWYQEKLGFEVVNDNENTERGFRQANLKRDKSNLELLELDSAINTSDILDQHGPRARLTGFFKFGYSVSDFDYWTQHMNETEAVMNGRVVADPISGKRTAVYFDPDGNRIQIFEK